MARVGDRAKPEPVEWVSPRSIMAKGGADDLGLEIGDEFDIEFDDEEYHVTVVSISPTQSVLRANNVGPPTRDSVIERIKRFF